MSTGGALHEPLDLSLITPRLSTVSPSRFQALELCAAREVWAASSAPALLPVSPSARMGTAIHKLLEEAGSGRFVNGGDEAVKDRWLELLADAELAMAASPLERHLLPLTSAVGDFEVRGIQVLRRAEEMTSVLRTVPVPPVTEHPDRALYGLEFPVATADGRVRGKIDAVLPSATGPLIRDYKSGAVFEGNLAHQVLKESYQEQLKLYAALYQASTGTWPVRLEIVPLSGPAIPVQFSPNECLGLLVKAIELLDRVQELIRSTRSSDLADKLARPSAAACSFCSYRPGCRPYLAAISALDKRGGWPMDVVGELVSIQELGNSKLLIRLRTGQRIAKVRGVTPGTDRHEWLADIRPGNIIGVFGLRGDTEAGSFEESRFTTIYGLSSVSTQGRQE